MLFNQELLRERVGAPALSQDLPQMPSRMTLPIPVPSPGTVQIVTGPGVIGFKLNGILAWAIDEKWFGGNPVLTQGAVGAAFRVELKGALYPGTSLPADFLLLLGPRGLSGTAMNMTMTLGAFHGQSIFELWLSGRSRLTSQVQLNNTACPLGPGSLTLQAAAFAEFTPNWLTA